MKFPHSIIDQTTKRGRLSLIDKVQGVRPNIDDIRRWEKLKWKLRGILDIISLPNDYMLFIFGNKEDQNEILSSAWFIGNRALFLERWHPEFDPTKA